jgi:hypothetical protein
MRAIAAAVIHPAVPPPTITIDRIRSATLLFLPKLRRAALLQHVRHFLSGSAQHLLPKAARSLKQEKC